MLQKTQGDPHDLALPASLSSVPSPELVFPWLLVTFVSHNFISTFLQFTPVPFSALSWASAFVPKSFYLPLLQPPPSCPVARGTDLCGYNGRPGNLLSSWV